MLVPPRLPLLVRAGNALARPVARALPQLSLAPERAGARGLSFARGLADFGDDDAWRSGLDRVLRRARGRGGADAARAQHRAQQPCSARSRTACT